MKTIFVTLVIASVLLSCKDRAIEVGETSFYFDKPQPDNDSELKNIPSKFWGSYIFNDSKTLNITDKIIYYQYTSKVALLRSVLDSIKDEITLKNNKIIFIKSNKSYDFAVRNDSVYLTSITTDTVFIFSDKQKAKRLNGDLVLNTRDSVFWNTSVISIKNDTLNWKHIINKEDYITLQSVIKNIKTNADTTAIYLKPSRKEFGKIIKIKELKYKKVE